MSQVSDQVKAQVEQAIKLRNVTYLAAYYLRRQRLFSATLTELVLNNDRVRRGETTFDDPVRVEQFTITQQALQEHFNALQTVMLYIEQEVKRNNLADEFNQELEVQLESN